MSSFDFVVVAVWKKSIYWIENWDAMKMFEKIVVTKVGCWGEDLGFEERESKFQF